LNKIFIIVIVSFFSSFLNANETSDAIQTAKKYEKDGDIENAMQWYKKAALLSIAIKNDGTFLKDSEIVNNEVNATSKIVKYGKNDIEGYDNNVTDSTVKQILYAAFDAEPYKTNYFLPFTYDVQGHADRSHSEVKFQLSFKKNLAKNLLGLNEELFFGYTQTAWWQFYSPSIPFRETNYEPEIFIFFPYYTSKTSLKALQVGLLHQSNGKDSIDSRSWNRIYLRGAFQYKGIFINPRVWYRLPEKNKTSITDNKGDDNPDIYDYMGYGDLTITYPYKGNVFSLLLRNNLKFTSENRGAVQFDWTFPIAGVNDAFGYLQIFSGYGENLSDYDKRTDRIGLGIAITR